jgi:2,4-dienoyl-CoA reductase-like NADH-dependent reductase (Old Yellow Enzyme family)
MRQNQFSIAIQIRGFTMTISLSDPLTLPCGATLPNRLAKAAMTEGMASPNGVPTAELERLYGRGCC